MVPAEVEALRQLIEQTFISFPFLITPEIEIDEDTKTFTVLMKTEVLDRESFSLIPFEFRTSAFFSDIEFIETHAQRMTYLRDCVKAVFLHEMDEHLIVEGERVFDPHNKNTFQGDYFAADDMQ